MSLEILEAPRPPRPRPRSGPFHRGVWGYRYINGRLAPLHPVYYTPEIFAREIDTPNDAYPWRVVSSNVYGTNVLYKGDSMKLALNVYNNTKVPLSNNTKNKVQLQHWTGSFWRPEATKTN